MDNNATLGPEFTIQSDNIDLLKYSTGDEKNNNEDPTVYNAVVG